MPQQQFAFVQTDASAGIGSAERQLIRRHCMQRKNKQPNSRRSKREASRAAVGTSQVTPPSGILTGTKRMQPFCVPSAPPSDWALFPFPETLDVPSQKLMHEYFIHNPIRDPLCPFKLFGILVEFDQDPLWCFQLLSSEILCIRAILLLNSASEDLKLRQSLSKTSSRHFRSILQILNSRLSQTNAHEHEVILYVVSILASIAILFGDYNAAKTHAKGLSDIISLRGGLNSISHIPVIKLSIDRLNFSSALVTDLWTPIYNSSIWEIPVFSDKVMSLYYSQGMFCVDDLVDSNLATVFRTLQYTTIMLNDYYHNQMPISGTFLQKCLGYVHCRLVELEGQLKSDLSECLRLGMMALLATTFRRPHSYEQPYCRALTNKLQNSYEIAKSDAPNLDRRIHVWLVFACQISADKIGDQHTRPNLMGEGDSWKETREHLKQVIWIDAFHDELGRRAYGYNRVIQPERLNFIAQTL